MKKLMMAVTTVVLLTACEQKKQGEFLVSGTIKNAQGQKILLMELPFVSDKAIVLDSATLDKKGSFTLKGMAKEEGIYRLALNNGPDVIIVNDSKDITVKMDVNDPRHYNVEGSAASNNLHGLFENYIKNDSTLLSTFKELDTLAKQPGNDSAVAILRKKKDSELQTLNNLVKDFINNSNSPASTFYAIGLASRTLPPEEVKPLVDKAVIKYKDHSGLLAAQKMIAAQTTTAKVPEYLLLNQQAPDITLPDVNGNSVSLANFKGKYVLVDFWASWCGPCRAENPNVVKAYNKYKNKNFTIVGVSLDQDKNAWKQAIAKDNLTWTHISDLKQWESSVVQPYGIEGIPFNVLLDPQGKIIANGLRGEALERKLGEVLK